MSSGKELNEKQKMFCAEYLLDLNATQAAIRAGYSEKTANQQGPRLLVDAGIQEYIQILMDDRSKRVEVDADYVLKTIVDTVERCKQAEPVTDRKGNPILIKTPAGQIVPAYMFDAGNVLRGAELLGKHLELFTDRVKHSGQITQKIITHKDHEILEAFKQEERT